MAFMFPSIMLIMNVTTIAVVWFGGVRIDIGGMDMGSLVAFMQYSIQIMFSFIMVFGDVHHGAPRPGRRRANQ
jgi:ATP-binding cassette subfamily B protein